MVCVDKRDILVDYLWDSVLDEEQTCVPAEECADGVEFSVGSV